jgi:hypothetical protein
MIDELRVNRALSRSQQTRRGDTLVDVDKSDKVDVREIAAHSRALLGSGLVTRPIVLSALRQIKDGLKREFKFSDERLEPIRQLITELEVTERNLQAY